MDRTAENKMPLPTIGGRWWLDGTGIKGRGRERESKV